MSSEPVIPRYSGPNVRGLIPAFLGPRGVRRPEWIPAEAATAGQVVLLVLDGLGWEQLQQRAHLAPTLAAMSGGPITTVAPTTTATALTSITTGLTPGEHGLVGYRIDVGGDVMNVLRWHADDHGDARRSHEPTRLQPFAPFMGEAVPVVSKAELERSSFSVAHLRGGKPRSYRTPSGLAVVVGEQLRAGEPFVYAYYDGIDKIAHERGFGPFYDAELVYADRLVADVIAALPSGAALAVTADHGQVHVGDRIVTPAAELNRLVHHSSGEGRFRWLHARSGAAADLAAAAHEAHSDVAWVVTREQVLDEQWFGPVVSPPVQARLGDVAMVAREDVSFDDPADSGPYELVCRHGSLTSAEVYVPLLAAAP
ncbi:MAG: alkaline phosphatase family protein [Ilumatobacteraceae bacterium]